MGVCDIPVISTVCDVAGEAAAPLISAPFDWLASALGAAAGWLFEAVGTVFDSTTLVDVTSGEYVGVYNLIFGIAVVVVLVFVCLHLIPGMRRRRPAASPRTVLGLAQSVLGPAAVGALTAPLGDGLGRLPGGRGQGPGRPRATPGDKVALRGAAPSPLNGGPARAGTI